MNIILKSGDSLTVAENATAFEVAQAISEGLARIRQNGKWGFIDKLDIIVVPFNYDRIQCSDVFILGEQNYKTFIIANPYYNKVIQLDKVYYLVSSHRIG